MIVTAVLAFDVVVLAFASIVSTLTIRRHTRDIADLSVQMERMELAVLVLLSRAGVR